MTAATAKENRRDSERLALDATFELYVNTGVINGETIDVSQTGISFETSQPICVELKMLVDGQREERRARLIWSKQLPDGRLRYGMKFIDEE